MSPPPDGESPSDDPLDRSPATDEELAGGDGPDGHTRRDAERQADDRVPADRASDSPSTVDPDATGPGDDAVARNGGARTVDPPVAEHTASEAEDDTELRTFVFDVVSSAVAVLLVGVLLFAVSGVWPPMVAVESPSMTPNMKTGDLVFVMDEERFPGAGAVAGTGVVTAQTGQTTDYRKFAQTGDVIVYERNGNEQRTPIIHRAMFWVEEGENWYDEADRQAVGRYSECGDSPSEAMPNCPAPHAGFVTKGDANGVYDQVQGLSSPVKPEWVVGTAEVRVPKLGCIRLRDQGCAVGVRASPGAVNGSAPTFAGEAQTAG